MTLPDVSLVVVVVEEEEEVVMQYVQCNLPQSQSAYQRSTGESESWLWLTTVLCQRRSKTWTFLISITPLHSKYWFDLSRPVTSDHAADHHPAGVGVKCWRKLALLILILNHGRGEFWGNGHQIFKIVKSNIKFLSRLNWY